MDIVLERILSLLPKKPDGKFVRGAKKDFAISIGYDSGDIVSMWISGDSKSYERKLYQIADAYNVSVEWLKGETDIKEKPTAIDGELLEKQNRILELYSRADEQTKNEMIRYAEYLLSQQNKK